MLMMIQGFVLTVLAASLCDAQMAYNRLIPYDPRYVIRRVPVRRSADPDPHIRMPITRYFPQVDTQVAPAPYVTRELVAQPSAYGEVYAMPSKWAPEETIPMAEDDNEYDAYDYDKDFRPVYANNDYAAVVETIDPDVEAYNDMMLNYLLGTMQQAPLDEADYPEIQRRSSGMIHHPIAVSSIEKVADANKKQNSTVSSTTASPTTTAAAKPTPAPTRNTATAAVAPQKMISRPRAAPEGLWHNFEYPQMRGQKEIPQYRPKQMSPLASLESQLARSKSTTNKNKDALPIIEKMMSAAHGSQDPLKEQLDSLKYRNM